MARPQEFSTPDALRAAMHLFWRRGFEATSMTDLLNATGLSKSSLYATFGGKRELFLAALDAYREEQGAIFRETLASGDARTSLETYFRRIVATEREPEYAFGCMSVCQLVEMSPRDPEVQQRLLADMDAGAQQLAEIIAKGQNEGSVRSKRAPLELAQLLSVAFAGLQVLVRAGADRRRLDSAVTALLANLD
ncbi:TetR family transcriptional regulator [Phenylobacterium sp. Root77]|uniref:TetR/AcrR family transcriptional regulator n=1 Tax=unclassified Phenylobacterium TaxID=2640670 RepID=UPI0006F81A41|nr:MULTISPECIES: TetR/AcrR family transcriptional regulator [unclassified Phenylobacterium]KQW65504.1 TetR family transcriptional regulator [Phenylobacterium sp. Root1277]KQW94189.1 TetR family transcriptional regulator [Phenylobacterium sp. Root1290]KRC39009.1 TetR family transcriptional regulator [Phenylobacterium sp. Root77]